MPPCLLLTLDNVITFCNGPGWDLLSQVQHHFVAEAAKILFLDDKPMDRTVYLKPGLTSISLTALEK